MKTSVPTFDPFSATGAALAVPSNSKPRRFRFIRRWQPWILSLALVSSLACGQYGTPASDQGPAAGVVGGSGGGIDPVAGAAAFLQTTYPIVAARCATCHSGAGPGSPSIAHPDLTAAYGAVVNNQKVNLGTPINSRLVQRLVADFHFCWSDCAVNGEEMRQSVAAWAALVAGSSGGTGVSGLESAPLTLADGVEEVSEERYKTGLIALWEFKEGTGDTAFDTSGVAPAIDLDVQGGVWMPSYGLEFNNALAIAPKETSRKLYDKIADPSNGTQQFSVEAWVIPASTDQDGPARIVTYSSGTNNRNFTLGQVTEYYDFRNRSLALDINNNGSPSLQTNNDEDDLKAALQHVVITFDRYRGRRIYVNGVWTDDSDANGGATLWNWNPDYRLALARETSNNRQWVGKIQYLAIYDHAMPDAEILRNFTIGVGKKLRLRFDVGAWIGTGNYVEFGVSELDSYSYLFCQPTVAGPNTAGLSVQNLRIAVNDTIPVSGQAFTNVSAVVDPTQPELSSQCSIIQKDLGSASDTFKVVFEVLGDYSDPVVINNPPPPVDNSVDPPLPIEGVRNFARLNNSMSEITGVPSSTTNVETTFNEIQEQLPPSYDLRSFVSSNQVGITKLALDYCDTLVESQPMRDAFFGISPAFEFDQPVATAFSDQTKRDIVINALGSRMLGTNLTSQPSTAEVAPVLNTLIDDLSAQCGISIVCDDARTRSIVKAMCASMLSSAAVSMH